MQKEISYSIEVVSSAESLVSNRWLSVSKEQIAPDDSEYYLASKGDVAMVAGLTKQGNVLLIQEYKHGCRGYVWQFPAGLVGTFETPIEAAHRELLEETGYTTPIMEPHGFFYVSPPLMPDRVFLFIARDIKRMEDPCLERGEKISVRIMPLGEAIEMTMANEIKDPVTCFGLRLLWRGF